MSAAVSVPGISLQAPETHAVWRPSGVRSTGFNWQSIGLSTPLIGAVHEALQLVGSEQLPLAVARLDAGDAARLVRVLAVANFSDHCIAAVMGWTVDLVRRALSPCGGAHEAR